MEETLVTYLFRLHLQQCTSDARLSSKVLRLLHSRTTAHRTSKFHRPEVYLRREIDEASKLFWQDTDTLVLCAQDCIQVTDRSLSILLLRCPHLKELRVHNLPQVSGAFLPALLQCKQLRYLSLQNLPDARWELPLEACQGFSTVPGKAAVKHLPLNVHLSNSNPSTILQQLRLSRLSVKTLIFQTLLHAPVCPCSTLYCCADNNLKVVCAAIDTKTCQMTASVHAKVLGACALLLIRGFFPL